MNLSSKSVAWHVGSVAAGAWGMAVFAQTNTVDLFAIVGQLKKVWGDLVVLSTMAAPFIAAGAAAYRTWGSKQVPTEAVAVVPAPLTPNAGTDPKELKGLNVTVAGKVVGALLFALIFLPIAADAQQRGSCWACMHGCTPLTELLNCGTTPPTPKKKHVRPKIKHSAMEAFAQARPGFNLPAPLTSSTCEPLAIFKGLTPQNFLVRIKTCTDDDLSNAIADARSDPVDYQALACLLPVQTIKNAIVKGGLLTAFQGFRRAKNSGLLLGCTNYIASTVTLQ